MKWGEGPSQKNRVAKKQGALLRRATVTPGGYTADGSRKSRAKPLPDGLRKFFRPVGGA